MNLMQVINLIWNYFNHKQEQFKKLKITNLNDNILLLENFSFLVQENDFCLSQFKFRNIKTI